MHLSARCGLVPRRASYQSATRLRARTGEGLCLWGAARARRQGGHPHRRLTLHRRLPPLAGRTCSRQSDWRPVPIGDNLSSHKSPPITASLEKYPRVHQVFTRVRVCWLNLQDRPLCRTGYDGSASPSSVTRPSRPGRSRISTSPSWSNCPSARARSTSPRRGRHSARSPSSWWSRMTVGVGRHSSGRATRHSEGERAATARPCQPRCLGRASRP